MAWLSRHADLAAELIQQYAACGQTLAQRRELTFQPIGSVCTFRPQPYRQARLVQLQFTLYGTERGKIHGKTERPAMPAVFGVDAVFKLQLQHVATICALQRNLDHPGRHRARFQLRHLQPGQCGLDIAVQPGHQRRHVFTARK